MPSAERALGHSQDTFQTMPGWLRPLSPLGRLGSSPLSGLPGEQPEALLRGQRLGSASLDGRDVGVCGAAVFLRARASFPHLSSPPREAQQSCCFRRLSAQANLFIRSRRGLERTRFPQTWAWPCLPQMPESVVARLRSACSLALHPATPGSFWTCVRCWVCPALCAVATHDPPGWAAPKATPKFFLPSCVPEHPRTDRLGTKPS